MEVVFDKQFSGESPETDVNVYSDRHSFGMPQMSPKGLRNSKNSLNMKIMKRVKPKMKKIKVHAK